MPASTLTLNPNPNPKARVAGINEMMNKVDMLKLAAAEADKLEQQFTSLASTASRLPMIRLQVRLVSPPSP